MLRENKTLKLRLTKAVFNKKRQIVKIGRIKSRISQPHGRFHAAGYTNMLFFFFYYDDEEEMRFCYYISYGCYKLLISVGAILRFFFCCCGSSTTGLLSINVGVIRRLLSRLGVAVASGIGAGMGVTGSTLRVQVSKTVNGRLCSTIVLAASCTGATTFSMVSPAAQTSSPSYGIPSSSLSYTATEQ